MGQPGSFAQIPPVTLPAIPDVSGLPYPGTLTQHSYTMLARSWAASREAEKRDRLLADPGMGEACPGPGS